MLNALGKLLMPGDGRISRLRDAQNNLVPISRLIRNGPRAVGTTVLVRALGRRPTQPWISYDAIKVIKGLLNSKSRVLEYGSGMSTVWYARHSRSVISVEDDPYWAEFNQRSLARCGLQNGRIVAATDKSTYVSAGGSADAGGQRFDFIVIDGRYRDSCAERALEVIEPGGWIYLDNSDVIAFNDLDGDVGRAKDLIVQAAQSRGGTQQYFVDFSPGCLHPTGGTLVQL